MNKNTFVLALIALAAIMLVGCKEPAGLPSNKVHAAAVKVLYCTVGNSQDLSGYVDYYLGSNTYGRSNPTIKWGYVADRNGNPNPRSNGFCQFTVPAFGSPCAVPQCSLFYYETAHSGTPHLNLKWLSGITTWNVLDSVLYWAVENGTQIGYDTLPTTDNCWHACSLNNAGMTAILNIGSNGGGTLVTGWRYDGSTSGTYATADGATQSNPPYIKVWYDDGKP